jgi:hypothetical protein
MRRGRGVQDIGLRSVALACSFSRGMLALDVDAVTPMTNAWFAGS